MHEQGLQVRRKRTQHKTTDSAHMFHCHPNLAEHLEIMCPEQVWVSDNTSTARLQTADLQVSVADVEAAWHMGNTEQLIRTF